VRQKLFDLARSRNEAFELILVAAENDYDSEDFLRFTICRHVLRHRGVPPHHSEIPLILDRVINMQPRLLPPDASWYLVASESREPVACALAYSRHQARSH